MADPGQQAVSSATALLHQHVSFHPEEQSTLADLVWQALDRSDVLAGDTVARFYADELARRYEAENPLRMAQIILVRQWAQAIVTDLDAPIEYWQREDEERGH